jgi:hypothetical protein
MSGDFAIMNLPDTVASIQHMLSVESFEVMLELLSH